MIGLLLLVGFVLLSGGQTILNKIYQTNVKMNAVSYCLYLIVLGGVAAICFFFIGGCDISGNVMTLVFGFAASLIVILNCCVLLLSMAKVNLAFMTVAQNAGTLVIPTMYGVLFLGESLSLFRIIGIILIIKAFLVSFFADLSKSKGEKSGKGGLGYLICVFLFITAGAGNVIHKAYTVSSATGSNAAYLCWINIFMVPVIIIALLFFKLKSAKTFKELCTGINFKYYIPVCIGSALGCFGMICSMGAMARMDMSVYSTVYSSLFIIFMTLMSKFFFKEHISKQNYISVGLAILSVIFSSI